MRRYFLAAAILTLLAGLSAADRLITAETIENIYGEQHTLALYQTDHKNLYRLAHYQANTLETTVIFEGQDKIVNGRLKNLSSGLLAFWQTVYGTRYETYAAFSYDEGRHFSPPLPLQIKEPLKDLDLSGDNLLTVNSQEVILTPLIPPRISHPALSSTGSFEYILNNPGPQFCRLEISAQADFPAISSWLFEEFVLPGSSEIHSYSLPLALPDGRYFARLQTSNGLQISSFSPTVIFDLDATPPTFTSIEAQRRRGLLFLTGRVNGGGSQLTINGSSFTLDPAGTFTASFELSAGYNRFLLSASDEAGNLGLTTEALYFNPASPEVTIDPALADAWFNQATTIFLTADIFDLQNDLAPDCPTSITLNGRRLESSFEFDQESGQLSGLFILPADLNEGRYRAVMTVSDSANNSGSAQVEINIDKTPPQLNSPDQRCFVNDGQKLNIPLFDNGAGVDPAGTLFSVNGVSIESRSTNEAGELILVPRFPLKEGSYEATVTPRDRVGNIGQARTFSLIIDTTPPILTITSTPEVQAGSREACVAGCVFDTAIEKIDYYLNNKLVDSQTLDRSDFSNTIRVNPGINELKIEAVDRAGNKTSRVFSIKADYVQGFSLIDAMANGPNPYDPAAGLHYFTYNLSASAKVKIYIFSLTGDCLWTKEIDNTAAGNITWDGHSSYGQLVTNGVYPFVLTAAGNGVNEIKRGYVIVLQ